MFSCLFSIKISTYADKAYCEKKVTLKGNGPGTENSPPAKLNWIKKLSRSSVP
jgi:hypothetical protein